MKKLALMLAVVFLAAGPLKKDGTPDMRYKDNKTTTSTSTTTKK
jgi:hypothetical protein